MGIFKILSLKGLEKCFQNTFRYIEHPHKYSCSVWLNLKYLIIVKFCVHKAFKLIFTQIFDESNYKKIKINI